MSIQTHRQEHTKPAGTCAVITCSDTRTLKTDTSGQLIVDLLEDAGHHVVERRIISDDEADLGAALDQLVGTVDAVLITGGTGLAARDITTDVVERRLERVLPGFGELFRMLSWEEIGSASMLSRAVAGVEARTFIASMPGSTAAVRLAMKRLIVPELSHVIGLIRE